MAAGTLPVQDRFVRSLSCILLMVERGAQVHAGLAKALTLARHTGARLELLLCESEPCPGMDGQDPEVRAAREQCLQRGREYLRALREGILCADVQIDGEVVCAASLFAGVMEKMRRNSAQMIVRASSNPDSAMAVLAWRLVRQSGTPLLLTRGRPWQAAPLFVAALNPSGGAAGGSQLGPLSELLRSRCGARVDYLVASAQGLPGIIAERDYDLVMLTLPASGVLDADAAHAARLLQTCGADLLLAVPGPAASADTPQLRQPIRYPDRTH
jgi:hypothetical protein